jgi:uncharacterized protein YaaW (UPF0174 family)
MKTRIALALVFGLFLPLLAERAIGADDNWRNLSPKEKDRVQRNYQRWKSLPPQDKEHLRGEWNRYQRLPKDQQDRLKQRYNDQRRDRRED